MSEYIEREAALQVVADIMGDCKVDHKHRAINRNLKQIPAADVVEVVRCKDCKLSSEPKAVSRLDLYSNNYDVRFCQKEQKLVCGTHFCSYGAKTDGKGEG